RAAFVRDGKQAVSLAGDCLIRVWDTATGMAVRSFNAPTGTFQMCLAVSSDGRELLTGSSDQTLRLWDLATGKEIRSLVGHTSVVQDIAFCPDGKRALSAGGKLVKTADGLQVEDCVVRVWDLATGQAQFTLQGHTKLVHAVAASPDGRYAASASNDG